MSTDSRLAGIEAVIADVIGLKPGTYSTTALRHALYAARRQEREAGLAIYAAKLREIEEQIAGMMVEATGGRLAALEDLDHACAGVWCCAEYRAASDTTEQHSDECHAALCDIDCATRRSVPGERLSCDCGWGADAHGASVSERSVSARDAIGREWERMRAEGFRGTNAEVLAERDEAARTTKRGPASEGPARRRATR